MLKSITHRLLAIAVLLFSTAAAAQFGSQTIIIFPGVPSGSCSATQLGLNNANGNLYSCGPGSAWLLIGPSATAANPGGSANQIQFNSGGVSFGGFTMSQDCTIVVATGVITCTKTNNVAFAASATTDTTIATNISSGTLAGARMSAVNLAASGNGGVTGLLALANGGTGTASPGLVQGSNITITGSWPNQTIAASGGTGTVTSIATTAPIAGGTITASGTISLQNSTPANITALTGTDTLVPTNSGAFTNGHSVVGDAQGGIADSGSANVTPTSTTTFTNKSIAGSEINSGLVASTVGGTGVNNSATLTLGSSNQNWATLGTGIVKNTTTTGALSDAASSDVIGLWTGSCSSSTYLNGAGACATPSGSGTVTGVTTAAPFTSQTISTSGTIAFPTTSVSGYPLVAVNGAQPAFSASSFKDSTNSPVSLASAAYVPACDSSTTTVDRGTNIVFITSNTQPINLPLSGASGCSGMYFRGQNLTGGNITINKNTTDTLTVTGGTGTQGTGQPSATITNNTYFSANQSSSGVWEITGLPSSSSAAFSALTAGTNTSAAMVVGSGSSLTPTGTGYINSTNGVQSTFGASGTTLCDRFNTQATAFSLEVITSEGEAGSIFNCADIDIDNPTNGWRLNGQTIIQTDEGFHIGNRETIDGYVGNVGLTAVTSGTQFQTSAAFPLGTSGGAITTSGTNSSGSSSLKLAKGAVGILLSSYETLTISGDATVYYLKACATGTGNCANSDTSISQYSLPASGTVTVGVVPNLASSPTSGTAVTLTAHPLIQFQDQNVTAANNSPSGVQIHNMFISCNANAGVGTGLLDVYAQENSEARNVYITNCGRGFWIPSGANSGDWTNLNVGYTSSSDCPSPTIPFEISGAHKRVSRVTITTQTCASTKITTGIFHVTNAQLGGISSPGGIVLDNVHGEAQGLTSGVSIDMILVDSVNPSPAGITGPVEISEPSGCPLNGGGSPPTFNACKNLVHVASNFSGTLNLHDGSCNSGTINAIEDDINGNTMLCSNNTNGIGFYRILEDGTAETNLNCTDMTKGWCITGNIRAYYLAGIAQFKMNGPTLSLGSSGTLGSVVMGNATSGLVTLEPTTGAITSYTIGLPVAQPTAGNTFLSCTAANPAVCTWAAGGGSSSWSALTNPSGNLSLSMGSSDTSSFSYTSGLTGAFEWLNSTTGTVSTTNQSPSLELNAQYYNGSASGNDTWSIYSSLAAGANGASTLNFGHSGSSGTALAQFPGPVASGTTGNNPGQIQFPGNTSTPVLASNTVSLNGPSSTTFTDYGFQFSTTGPAGAGVFLVGAPSSGLSALTYGQVNSTVCTACVWNNAINTGTSAMTLDLSAATTAPSFKLPQVVGGTSLAGTSSGNLSAPIVLTNANSTNNNTSFVLGVSASGSSTGQTVMNLNQATTGGDILDWGTGGSYSAGVLSGQTISGSILENGSVQIKGTTAGFHALAQGTTSAAVSPCNASNTICEQAPTAVTSYLVNKPGVAAQGIQTNIVTSAVDTQGFSGDSNHSATVSWSTATSVSSTSLCSTTNCPVGTYLVSGYIDVTTACTTTGSYIVNLIYTDDTTVSKTVVVPFFGLGYTTTFGPTAVSSTLVPVSTTDYGSIVPFTIHSTGAASINYSSTASACGTGGPGVGKLYLAVTPIQ